MIEWILGRCTTEPDSPTETDVTNIKVPGITTNQFHIVEVSCQATECSGKTRSALSSPQSSTKHDMQSAISKTKRSAPPPQPPPKTTKVEFTPGRIRFSLLATGTREDMLSSPPADANITRSTALGPLLTSTKLDHFSNRFRYAGTKDNGGGGESRDNRTGCVRFRLNNSDDKFEDANVKGKTDNGNGTFYSTMDSRIRRHWCRLSTNSQSDINVSNSCHVHDDEIDCGNWERKRKNTWDGQSNDRLLEASRRVGLQNKWLRQSNNHINEPLGVYVDYAPVNQHNLKIGGYIKK